MPIAHGGHAWLGALPLGLTWAACLAAALRARVDARGAGLRGRVLIGFLTYLGPLLRCLERYRWWARGLSEAEPVNGGWGRQPLPVSWRERAFSVSFWTEHGLEKESILDGLRAELAARKYFAVVDEGWSNWDLEVQGGLWSRGRVTVATEYHGGERRVLRVKTALRASLVTRIGLVVAILAAVLGAELRQPVLFSVGAAGIVLAAGAFAREALNLGRMLHGALQTVGRRVRLHYAPPLADGEQEDA